MHSSISRRRMDGVGKKLANIAYKHISSFGHQCGQLKENFPGFQTPEHFNKQRKQWPLPQVFQGCSCNQQLSRHRTFLEPCSLPRERTRPLL